MRLIYRMAVCVVLAFTAVSTAGCKDACDDLEDICKKCNSEYKDECKSEHNACTIVKGPASKDCCDAIVDMWDEECE